MAGGQIVTGYEHTGLGSETTRHYRVFATNTQGTGVASNIAHATTADIAAPVPESASVAAAGDELTIAFSEALDATEARLPAPERFAVTVADGAEIVIGSVAVSGTTVTIDLASGSPVIKTGQSVTVAYTDRTTGNDPGGVVQDDSGNDAAPFTLGPGETVTVTNSSTVAATVPGAPTGLAAQGAGNTSIQVTWTKPANTGGRAITGYLVEVSSDGGTTYPVGGQVTITATDAGTGEVVTEYTHTGLILGNERHYRVSATNAVGTGAASTPAMGVTVPPGSPGEPTGLTATAGLPATPNGTTLITLAWTKPMSVGDSAIGSYRIDVSSDGTPGSFTTLVPNHDEMAGGQIVTGYEHTGLGSETTRHYRVFATNTQGTGVASNIAHATTADIAAPVPESASVAAAGDELTIAFSEALDATEARLPAPERFAVTVADGAEIVIGSVAVSGTTVTIDLASGSPVIKTGQSVTVAYTDRTTGNDPGGVVQDDSGNDAAPFTLGPGETVTVTNSSTVAATVPGAPTGLAAQGAGNTSIHVTWTKPANTGGRAITGYLIEISEGGASGPFTTLVANHDTMVGGAIETAYTQTTGLILGDERHYRVKAINAVGTGTASNVDGATTVHPGAPKPPTGLTAAAGLPAPPDGTTLIALAWKKPGDEGGSAITGYRIEWSEDVDPLVWQELEDDTGSRATRLRDTGLGSRGHAPLPRLRDQRPGRGPAFERGRR